MLAYESTSYRACCIAMLGSLFLGSTAAVASGQGPSAVSAPLPAPVTAVDGDQSPATIWVGVDFSPSSKALFGGVVYALNGDLSRDGFLVRTSVGLGEYDRRFLSGDTSDVSFQNASALVGYQHTADGVHVAFFIGPDFVHNGSGASADVRGSSWGVRGLAEVDVPVSPDFNLNTWATYTTIENQYYLQGRGLYRPSDRFKIGPEAAILGGDTWKQHRVGGHAAFAIPVGEIGVSVGHAWNSRSDAKNGVYANAILSIRL
jgi:hypothetical protein